MDYFLLIGILTLLLQFSVFLLIIGAVMFKRRMKFRAHGITMFTGVVLHLVTILVIMLPSFVLGVVPIIAHSPSRPESMLSPIHVVLGGTAAVLGVWIVSSWRFRKSLQFCAPKRRWMRYTFWVWIASLATGFLLFLIFYWKMLFS